MFDMDKIKRESGLTADNLVRLETKVMEEFPGDEMMFELHFLRIVKALKEGWVTLEEVLTEGVGRANGVR